jgi:hypothetical protein
MKGIILFSLIIAIYGNEKCYTNVPNYESSGGAIYPLCENYVFTFPPGQDYCNIGHHFGELVSQFIYQNGINKGGCNLSTRCTETVRLDRSLGYTIKFYRETKTNQNYAWQKSLLKRDCGIDNNRIASSEIVPSPEINSEGLKQDGKLTPGSSYVYEMPTTNNIYVDMQFNDSIMMEIKQNNITIYENFTNNFYFDLPTNCSCSLQLILSNPNNSTIEPEWTWIGSQEDFIDEPNTPTEESVILLYIASLGFGFSLICLTVLLFGLIYIRRYIGNKDGKNWLRME